MDVLTAMRTDAALEIKELRVDGGATANNLLLQFQANVLSAKVIRPNTTETTAIGAAYLAGLAIGFWKDVEEIKKQWKVDKTFTPEEDRVEELIGNWHRAVNAVLAWTETDPERVKITN
jgi:glycerol kinase